MEKSCELRETPAEPVVGSLWDSGRSRKASPCGPHPSSPPFTVSSPANHVSTRYSSPQASLSKETRLRELFKSNIFKKKGNFFSSFNLAPVSVKNNTLILSLLMQISCSFRAAHSFFSWLKSDFQKPWLFFLHRRHLLSSVGHWHDPVPWSQHSYLDYCTGSWFLNQILWLQCLLSVIRLAPSTSPQDWFLTYHLHFILQKHVHTNTRNNTFNDAA